MDARKYLVGVIAFVLLIWGPIDHSWSAWLLVRTVYLIVIPVAAWFVLGWIWKGWRPDSATEDRLGRTLAGATAGALIFGATLAVQAGHHYECTQEARTADGYECVGEYRLVEGPDFGEAFMLTLGAGFAFWFGVRRKDQRTVASRRTEENITAT